MSRTSEERPGTQRRAAMRALPGGDASDWVRGVRLVSAVRFRDVAQVRPHAAVARHWLVEVLVEGAMEVRVGASGWRRREAGQGMLYAPVTSYHERGAGAVPTVYRSVYIGFDDEGARLGSLLGASRRCWWIDDPARLLEPPLQDVADRAAGGPAAALAAAGSLLQVLARLTGAERRGDTLLVDPSPAAAPEFVRRLHRYLREHLAEPLRIADMAAHLGVSPSALAHTYRRVSGRTPMQALRELRVEVARHHLQHGRMKVEAIAEVTGFADAAHLSRTFKRLTGENPREARGPPWTEPC
jgi:AraC-like DNA-binding protein